MRGRWLTWPGRRGASPLPPVQGAAVGRRLNPSDPASWPAWPRRALQAAVALAVALPAWLLLSTQAEADLRIAQAREAELRQTYTARLAQSAQLAPLQQRRQALRELQATQEEQLMPNRPEILQAALHQAALQRGLQVDLMRPEPAQARGMSAGVPITLRLVGRYEALDAFAADVAALEPPVVLQDLQLMAAARDAGLVLDATARAIGRPEAADKAPRKAEARP